MKTRFAVGASLAATLLLAGCASTNPQDPYPAHHDPIVVRPAPDSPDAQALATGLNDAGYRLFHAVTATQEGDVVLSPLSIGTAFGMLDLGATDNVAAILKALFEYPIDGDARWSAFNTLLQDLVTEPGADTVTPTAPDGSTLPAAPIVRIANREFHDTDFSTVAGYDETLQKWFGAGIEPLPIRTDVEGSRKHINLWVSDKTKGLIPDLIPQGAMDTSTVMVLVNALYLKAQWASQFDVSATAPDTFTLLDGTTTSVPFMHNGSLDTTLATGDGYTAIDLPYAQSDLSMLVVVPDAGRYSDIEAGLGTSFVDTVESQLQPASVDLALPKFESDTSFSLRTAIESGLGIHGLFDVPELGGIGENVAVTDAVHAAKIKVDESGTEAAAATAIMVGLTSMPAQSVELKIDRPFLYVIRDNVTGAVLFVGRVMNPGA